MSDEQLAYWKELAQAVDGAPVDYDVHAATRKELPRIVTALAAAEQRVEAAEAKLAAVGDYAAYYAIAWEWFEADSDGPEPLTFAEWLDEQSEVQP